MELDHKKNAQASVYVDEVKIIDLENSMIYAKFDDENDDAYFMIRNQETGRSIKVLIKKYTKV